MLLQTQVGPQRGANAAYLSGRSGILGDLIASELHGRFYEANYQGNVFCVGLATLTTIANATFTTADALSATLGTAATTTPIIGLWNPLNSGVNAIILQAILNAVITASTVTGPGGLVWVVYTGNQGISVANQQIPVNCKTLLASGSQCKGLNTIALTGLAAPGIFLRASALGAGPNTSYSQVGTAVGFPNGNSVPAVENIDGGIIVPPGGILALVATTTPVAISVTQGLVWEEAPLL
jgi:hypothetical protein